LPAAPTQVPNQFSYPGFAQCADEVKCKKQDDQGNSNLDPGCCGEPSKTSCESGYIYCKGVMSCGRDELSLEYTTCCIQNSTNFTGCPATPSPPSNWKYGTQSAVPDKCVTDDSTSDLYRQVGTKDAEGKDIGKVGVTRHWPDYCLKVCKEQWMTPCSETCRGDFKAVYDKCSGCKGSKDYCIDSPDNSEDDKKEFDWAGRLPSAPSECKDEPERKKCTKFVVDHVEAGNTVSGLGVYVDTVTDADMMDSMTVWAPKQCKPPFHNWFNKDTYLCKECHSVIDEAEKGASIWGGSGYCDYANECTCPEHDSCNTAKMIECEAARTECQCDCRDSLTRASGLQVALVIKGVYLEKVGKDN
jgi:hypothetical protein